MKNLPERRAAFIALAGLFIFHSCTKQEGGNAAISQAGGPLTSYSEQITSNTHDVHMKAGGDITIDVDVKNTGSQPWFRDTPVGPVTLSYRWFSTDGKMLPIEGHRAFLSSPELKPGDTDALKLNVTAPPNPGSYVLRLSMVQEGVVWFWERGAKTLDVQATVD